MPDLLAQLTQIRVTRPAAVAEAFRQRKRRALSGAAGTLVIIAADHPGRGIQAAGGNPVGLSDRADLLRRVMIALSRPGVDGVLATPDVMEELLLLGALEEKLAIGCMNRGGILGSSFEADDRFTAYTPAAIADRLDGGKMMVQIIDNDVRTADTLAACAEAAGELARTGHFTVIEVLAGRRNDAGRIERTLEPAAMMRAIGIASALGDTSAFSWLKVPLVDQMPTVMRATSLPTLLLGGDPQKMAAEVFSGWAEAMRIPQVRGLVAGRALLFPEHGDVAAAVDAAVSLVSETSSLRGSEVRA
jgi:hypothetical protein